MGYSGKDERQVTTSRLSRAAKEAMKEWKEAAGIKAIVPKSKNQKLGQRLYLRRARITESREARKMSRGAASEVRHIEPEKTK